MQRMLDGALRSIVDEALRGGVELSEMPIESGLYRLK